MGEDIQSFKFYQDSFYRSFYRCFFFVLVLIFQVGCFCEFRIRILGGFRFYFDYFIYKEEREFFFVSFNEENFGGKCGWVVVRLNEYFWIDYCG